MNINFNIFLEAKDKNSVDFNFIKFILKNELNVDLKKEDCIFCDGYTNLFKSPVKDTIKYNNDNQIKNIILFDADNNYTNRFKEIEKNLNDTIFSLFLFPDDKNSGELEDLLFQFVNKDNSEINSSLDCLEKYITCLAPTILDSKTKLYILFQSVLKKISGGDYKFENTAYWNFTNFKNHPLIDILKTI